MPVRDLRSISTWLKIGLVSLSLAVLLFVIGFATISWQTWQSYRSYGATGLWRLMSCEYGRYCTSGKFVSATLPDEHKVAQAMECIGLIGLLLGFLLLLLYVFVDSCRRREAMLAILISLFIAVVAMVIGFIVFATYYNHDVGWSMGLAIAGCILTFIGWVMCLLQKMAK